ncbi:MAG TPA: hydroxyisourate hydrolase [Polyangiaceae bacterium]|jgi:5-hydroxyisourate hydrolase|nr:hydroxyisourate hydrolase [Polyangiaceae bacterium]
MTTISTHVLDTALGAPAAGVVVSLAQQLSNGMAQELGQATTNADGRISKFEVPTPAASMTLRLSFDVGDYLMKQGRPVFFPSVQILFAVSSSDDHLHVPLLLSPFGYTTYRGS